MYDFLRGITVIEMGHIALGPLASQMLGDYGANVIKVEAPTGDVYRQNGVARNVGMSAQWMACNRNKKSIALNMKSLEGKAVMDKLLSTANAFTHNMRSSAMARLGLDYDSVSKVNPDIVYCFAGGFGQDGPYKNYPAIDDVIQAYSGLASINGVATGQPELVPMVVCDVITGLNLGQALLAGLLKQQLQGGGACIEVPMYEVMAAAVLNQHLSGHGFHPPEADMGYRRVLDPARRPCATKDGYLVHGIYRYQAWQRFLQAVGRQDVLDRGLATDPQAVAKNIPTLYKITREEIMPTRTTAEWVDLFLELDLPFGKVQCLEDLEQDSHLAEVGLFHDYDHPSEGKVRSVRQPVSVKTEERKADRPPPRIGEDSCSILRDLGFPEGQIQQLRDQGDIVQAG